MAGFDLDIVSRERGVPVIGEQDAFAARRIIRDQLGAEFGILDMGVDFLERRPLEKLAEPASLHEGQKVPLEREISDIPLQLREPGKGAKASLFRAGERAVRLWYAPVRRALEDRQFRYIGRDLRHELDGAGTVADDTDHPAGEVHFMVPARRVKLNALEIRKAGNLRKGRTVELTDAGDENIRGHFPAVNGANAPETGGFIETRFAYLGIETDMREETVFAGNRFEILDDFRLRSGSSRASVRRSRSKAWRAHRSPTPDRYCRARCRRRCRLFQES